mgnify:CR=1 FL=1
MKKLKFETNVGHVEIFLKGGELAIEHAFNHQGKTFTMQINLDKQETKEVFKLLEEK